MSQENDHSDAQATIARRLRFQAPACTYLGSTLYAELLEHAAADVERGGPTWRLLEGHESDPGFSALALRLMGAVHRLVLEGRVPELGAHYPSVGGVPEDPWPHFRAALEHHREELRELVLRPVQTNEVRRCAALLPAFLLIAAETERPLHLLELGASAGLNLRFDRFHYLAGRQRWGPPDSPVELRCEFEGRRPSLAGSARVLERRGCDPDPIDALSEEGRLTLLSYVWADQTDRIRLLEGALKAARRAPAHVERASAVDWAPEQLRDPIPDVATVVYHSIVMQYLSPPDRELVVRALEGAGERASREHPLAWLRMEPAGLRAELRLTLWPGGSERRLARVGYHGHPVRWLWG
jgi:hypothetical protein